MSGLLAKYPLSLVSLAGNPLPWVLLCAQPDLVLCGYKDGTTILYSLKSKKKMCRYKPPEKAGEVRALEWDPLSDQFFLIGYSSGIICLCDSEREEFLNRLQDVGCGMETHTHTIYFPPHANM